MPSTMGSFNLNPQIITDLSRVLSVFKILFNSNKKYLPWVGFLSNGFNPDISSKSFQ